MDTPQQDALALFGDFMKAANAPGRIDGRQKKLMAIALSIAHHCRPCLKIHLKSAMQLGIPAEEIDEAAQLAIAFGGCTAMMFYKEVRQEAGL
ncbi:MAG TPA: carboxymuconolactone decarboxylase family protein [Candidatus Hydrogenedentes bacterium]|nr:carboxymuconolactone decarboxylase family protein [Candidatus Hydrogenedentota bacterium]